MNKHHGTLVSYAAVRERCEGKRGIKPRITRRGIDSSQRLGRHRWIVERAHA